MRRLLVLPLVFLVGCSAAAVQPGTAPISAPPPLESIKAVDAAEEPTPGIAEYWTPQRVAQLEKAKRASARRARKVTGTADATMVAAAAEPAQLPPAAVAITSPSKDVAAPAAKAPKPTKKAPKPAEEQRPRTSVTDEEFGTLVADAFVRLESGDLTAETFLAELRALGTLPLTNRQRSLLDELVDEVELLIEETSESWMPDMGFGMPPGIQLPTGYEVDRSLGRR